jgi:hypothetical protein
MGNFGAFAAPYITGSFKDATGSHQAPMFVVGGFLLLSAALGISITAANARLVIVGGRLSARTDLTGQMPAAIPPRNSGEPPHE